MRASVQITLNHALTMSASSLLSPLSAAWPRPIWQQSFVPSAESCPHLPPLPLPEQTMFYTYAEVFSLYSAANEFLFGNEKGFKTNPVNTGV